MKNTVTIIFLLLIVGVAFRNAAINKPDVTEPTVCWCYQYYAKKADPKARVIRYTCDDSILNDHEYFEIFKTRVECDLKARFNQ